MQKSLWKHTGRFCFCRSYCRYLEYNDPIGHFIDLYARKSDLNFCTFKLTLKRFYLNHMIVNFFQNQPSFYRFIILTFIRNVFEIWNLIGIRIAVFHQFLAQLVWHGIQMRTVSTSRTTSTTFSGVQLVRQSATRILAKIVAVHFSICFMIVFSCHRHFQSNETTSPRGCYMLIIPVILSICQQPDHFRHHFLFFDRKKLTIISWLHKKVPQKILTRCFSAIRSEPPNETMSFPALSKVRK